MKTILYMAITANGYIAKEDDTTDWTSEEDWSNFNAISKKTGTVVIGANTYKTMTPNQFVDDCQYIVLSHNQLNKPKKSNINFFSGQVEELYEHLKDKNQVCIAGGSHVTSQFLKAGLIDEIYIDIEPIVFGKGIPLFSPDDFEYQLKLLGTKKLNDNTIQLHYEVIK